MNRGQIARYTSYFFITALVGGALAFSQYVNFKQMDMGAIFQRGNSDKKISAIGTQCRPEVPLGLDGATSKYMQKLSEYQVLCGSKVADKYMVFTSMPNSKEDAQALAQRLLPELKAMQSAEVTPVVIVEPTSEWGLIDFTEFNTGFYDAWINDYFIEMKKAGLTDDTMGIWVPFPEANLPYWNRKNATPKDFAQIVNRYLSIYKTHFPRARSSILLNSATYESDDFDWERGEYMSLLPYVSDIKPGLVDSFGLQGFPWSPPATREGNGIFDAREFLNYKLAVEAASKLKVKEIWFNTGTFMTKYAQDEEKKVTIEASKRKDVSYGIVNEVIRAKESGFNVWVNVFAEDKSKVAEATDWSYLQVGRDHQQVFHDFIWRLNEAGIGISLYDVKK